MAGEIPEDLSVEPIWVVEATYGPDASERRAAVRAEHLRRVGDLLAAGTYLEAGGYLDFSTALLFVRAPDEAAAIALVSDDVYTRTGVWTGFTARQYGRVVRK